MEVRPLKIERDESQTEIINKLAPKQQNNKAGEAMAPRMLFVGRPGSGKTTTAISLVLDHLKCGCLFVYAKNQDCIPEYQKMREIIEKRIKKYGGVAIWEQTLENVVKPEELNGENYNVIMFDDMNNERAKNKTGIEDLYTNGRARCATTITLLQNYKKVNPNIRQQVSHLALFGGIGLPSLTEIWQEHCQDLTKMQFLNLYRACTDIKYGFLYIDTVARNPHERYRFKFDSLLDWSKLPVDSRRAAKSYEY